MTPNVPIKAAGTVTDNYVEARHEYFGSPDENGFRLRSVDVWYATRPTAPEYNMVDYDDSPIEGAEARVTTAWTIHKAGLETIYIYDRDDVAGLRALLDQLDREFDRRDMDALIESISKEESDDTDEA